MHKLSSWILLFAILISLCSVLSSCSNPSIVSGTDSIVTISLAKSRDLVGIDAMAASFEAEHPDIRVKLVDMPKDMDDRHRIYVSSLSGKDSSVDLYWIEDLWTEEFATQEYLLPLNNYLKLPTEAYLPQAIEKFTSRGQLYALPTALDMGFLYYRKDLVTEIPETWFDIFELSKKATEKYGLEYSVDVENAVSTNMLATLTEFSDALGNDWHTALKTYKNLLEVNKQNGSEKNYPDKFRSGDALFMRGWSAAWHTVNDDMSSVRGKVGITLLPKNGTSKTSALLSGYGIGINSRSKHIPQAVAFLEYLAADTNQRTLSRTYGYMPVLTELYQDEMVLDENPHFRGLLDVLPTLRQRNECSAYLNNYNELTRTLTKYFQDRIPLEEAEKIIQNMNEQ